MKSLSVWITSIFLLFFFAPLKAYECQITFEESDTYPMSNGEVQERLSAYLETASFLPFFKDNELQYTITNIFKEQGIIYVDGFLSQGETCLIALFSIDKGWFLTTTNLLYMTTDTLRPSIVLFKDIRASAQAVLPKSISNYHILIQRCEDPSLKKKIQRIWSFYNSNELIQLLVLTKPALDGGTDFMIHLLEECKWVD